MYRVFQKSENENNDFQTQNNVVSRPYNYN